MRFVEQTGSTNADMLADASAIDGDWLIALDQQAGRGRQGREWRSAAGNFFGSTLVMFQPDDPAAPTLSLAAGLALIEAVDAAAPGRPVMLKWPNDLMLGSDKLAGILLERSGSRVVAGFGVNLAVAPPIADRSAATLAGAITPQAFAPLLAASFARLLTLWRANGAPALARAWQARAHPVGTRLSVHSSGDERITGRFEGIDADGALKLRRDDGTLDRIRAGDVHL